MAKSRDDVSIPTALATTLALTLSLAASVRGQDSTPKKPEPSPSPAASAKPDDKKPDDKKPDDKKPDDKKPDVKKSDEKPRDPDDLARILERFHADKEPVRALECAYARALYFHLAHDLDRVVACFHPDLELHQANGEVVTLPLDDLRAQLKRSYESTPPSKMTLAEMVDFPHIRVYTKEEAHASKDEGWHKEPREISLVMSDEDRLVIAPVRAAAQGDKPTAFDAEVFYVFRRDGSDWKIVLAE